MRQDQTFGHATASIRFAIRSCREEDLPALEWMGLFSAHRNVIHKAFHAQKRGEALLLLAVTAGFPIGQVWLDMKAKKDEGTAVFWAVRTFFPLQGAGIGRCLMTSAESFASTQGFAKGELAVEQSDRRAIAFYQRLGWTTVRSISLEHGSSSEPSSREKCDHWLMSKQLGNLLAREHSPFEESGRAG